MNQSKIGDFLKVLRKEKGLTQEEFAEIVNMSNRTISRWENGNSMPDIDILVEISDFYNVDIRELLDIMLPGMDGFELLEYMEERHIPVIYMTAKTDSASEIKGLRDGAEDYITKPFEMMTLLVRMEKVLARFHKMQEIYCIGGLQIDVMNKKVERQGMEIKLTPIEFQVLEILVKYKNRTISRDTLLNEVWGETYYGDMRTVDVRISQLRKKLDLDENISHMW